MQKLIKIKEDHYVIVDYSEIKEGDWYISPSNGIISDHNGTEVLPDGWNEITHSTQPLELLSENGLSGMGFSKVRPLNIFEVKELIGEVDLEILAANLANPNVCKTTNWIEGYNQALEDNKEKKYTEEDLGLFLEYVRDNYTGMGAPHLVHNKGGQRKTKVIVQDYIQSLQPKTEWEVEMVDGKLKLK